MNLSASTRRAWCLSRPRAPLSSSTLPSTPAAGAGTVATASPTSLRPDLATQAATVTARWGVGARRLGTLAAATVAVIAVAGVIAVATAAPAWASDIIVAQAPASFDALITNLRNLIAGWLVGLSTLFVMVGGVRLLAADGDPGQVERAKRAIRNGLIGYALAALAPMIVTALRSLVG